MKTLYLLRHAKSDWRDTSLKDIDRPLNPRGRRASENIGHHLNTRGWKVDLVLCSTAVRAEQTWRGIAALIAEIPQFRSSCSLYQASSTRLLRELQAVSGAVDRVMLIGHNPEIAETASRLIGAGSESESVRKLERKYPTGGLAVFSVEIGRWSELVWHSAKLLDFVRPKDLE